MSLEEKKMYDNALSLSQQVNTLNVNTSNDFTQNQYKQMYEMEKDKCLQLQSMNNKLASEIKSQYTVKMPHEEYRKVFILATNQTKVIMDLMKSQQNLLNMLTELAFSGELVIQQ